MITLETRREAYRNVLKDLGHRQSQVFTELLCHPKGATASELAREMHNMGFFLSADRNNVHPRLNELVRMGIVETPRKVECSVTHKTVALYKVADEVSTFIKEAF